MKTVDSILRNVIIASVVMLAGLIFLATPGKVSAATCNTRSGGSGSWNDPANWDCSHVPLSDDDVIISKSTTIDENTTEAITVNSLTVVESGVLTIGVMGDESYPNKQLIVTGDFNINAHGQVTCYIGTTQFIDLYSDFDNQGDFNRGISEVRFLGSGNQSISGSPYFYNLTIDNTGTNTVVSTNLSVSVENDLYVNGGLFTPNTGSTFTNVYLSESGVLKPVTNAIINITGNWSGYGGTFTHNGSNIVFNGGANQSIYTTSSSRTFYNLTISNTCDTPSDDCQVGNTTGSYIYVNQTLNITSGQFSPGNLSRLHDVLIAPTGIIPSIFKPRPTSTITVSGDWTNSGTFSPNLAGTITFNGSITQTIQGISLSRFYNLNINNSAGVNLTTVGAYVDHSFILTNGLVTLGPGDLTLGDKASVVGTPTVVKMVVADHAGRFCKNYVDSTPIQSFLYPIGDTTGTIEYTPGTLAFTSGDFTSGQVCMNLRNDPHPMLPDGTLSYIDRYWSVTYTGITNFSVNVTFPYMEADIHGTEAMLEGAHYSPTPGWAHFGSVDTSANVITGSVTSFSDFTAFGDDYPTAVDFVTLTASKNNDAMVSLDWQTVSETKTLGFNIYRSDTANGVFTQLNPTLIAAKAAGSLNGSAYSFVDLSADPAKKYFYKLEVIGSDMAVQNTASLVYTPSFKIFLGFVIHP